MIGCFIWIDNENLHQIQRLIFKQQNNPLNGKHVNSHFCFTGRLSEAMNNLPKS